MSIQTMTFEDDVARFVEQHLEPRGLPKEIFMFNDYFDCTGIDMPNGIAVIFDGNNWYFDYWYQPNWHYSHDASFKPDQECDIDSLLDDIARQRTQKKEQEELGKKVAALEAENAKLRRKIEKLQLAPGGKAYEVAKKHFDSIKPGEK